MNSSKNYLNSLKNEVLIWELAKTVQIIREKYPDEIDAGFLRIKVIFQNNDILELSEYVQNTDVGIEVKSYTYHWQDAEGNLKKRWDNAKHHVKVSTYPHHLHEGDENNVTQSDVMNFEKVEEIIKRELRST